MSRIIRVSLAMLTGLFLVGAVLGQDDDDKKKADAERTKKAFAALMSRAEEEYRIFFKKPEQVHEFWAAIKFEMDVGKFDLAALHLKLMLELPPEKADPELLKITSLEGLSTFTRLQTVRIWSVHEPFQKEAEKNVHDLLDRVRKTLEDHLGDAKRINFFIENLGAKTREEREFAKAELDRSRERVTPLLVEALRFNEGKPLADHIAEYMVTMDEDMLPPLFEIFKVPFPEPGDAKDLALREKDAQDPLLRLAILKVLKMRNDIRREKALRDDLRVVPYLWHIAGSPGAKSRIPYHPLVRQKAREMLAYLLRVDADRLPPSEIVLTDMAEHFYQKKEKFRGRDRVPLWRWNSVNLAAKPLLLTPQQAQEIFALRYAKEALDLAPTHLPAQRVLLSQQMDTLYRPDVNKMLLDKAPLEWKDLDDLLAAVDADLLASTLEKAMDDNNVPVILGAIRALARRGDPLASKVVPLGPPRGLVRALDYPDRRVQWSALIAMATMPPPPPAIGMRMIDLIQRNLAADGQPRVLGIGLPDVSTAEVRMALKEMGFTTVLERDFKTGFKRLRESPDFELVLLSGGFGKELPYFMGQIRADVDQAMLPVIVVAPGVKADPLDKEREAMARADAIKLVETRMREERLKKAMAIELAVKDLSAREKAIKEVDDWAAKEKARRLKEVDEALLLEGVSRRMAASREFEARIEKSLSKHRNVRVVPETHLTMPEALRKALEESLEAAHVARLSAEERAWLKTQALGLSWAMSRGELPGYALAPLVNPLVDMVRSKATPEETLFLALETLSRLPGAEIQQNLAAVSLNPAREKMRIAAAIELNRHVKKYGLLLSKTQLKEISRAHADPKEDERLRSELALVIGATAPSPRLTGDRLFDFRPVGAPPPMKKGGEKEKEKKDE